MPTLRLAVTLTFLHLEKGVEASVFRPAMDASKRWLWVGTESDIQKNGDKPFWALDGLKNTRRF